MNSKRTNKHQRSTRYLLIAWRNNFQKSLVDIPEKFNAFMSERGIVWPKESQ